MQHTQREDRVANVEDSAQGQGGRGLPDPEAAFRELLELAPDAVTILVGDSDSDRRVINANTAACRLYRYGFDQLCGLRLSDLLEPEAAARLRRELPSTPGRTYFSEERIRRSDGTFVPVEGRSKVLPDGRLLSIVRDISDRKRAEREREELLSRIVAVSVTNEGPALNADEIARIFERFQRTDSAKLQGIQGVGLGLYITRSLVEAHGGCITAESTAEGVTTFRFTLPRMSDVQAGS